jgi:hypothetical protein
MIIAGRDSISSDEYDSYSDANTAREALKTVIDANAGGGGGGSGESNTGSNVGAAGVGVFKQKSGVTLQFKNINAGSNKVSITDDVANNEVDVDIEENNLDIANGTIQFILDGNGFAITTGIKGDIILPDKSLTIQSYDIVADQSGSISIDLWKDTYANFPPDNSDSITASAPIAISATTKGQDSTLTGWTKSLNAKDIIRINVDSCSTIQRVTVTLHVKKS